MQIFENKKEITTIIKELRTCFDKINQQFMLWTLKTTKLKNIYKHASLLQEKHKEKKSVIKNNLLHGALLLLEMMF